MENLSFVNFYCSHCSRSVDSSCYRCQYFNEALRYRLELLEYYMISLKDVFDMCHDDDDLKTKVRLNMSSAFDTALDLFYDCFSLDLYDLSDTYDDLPEQFDLQFLD